MKRHIPDSLRFQLEKFFEKLNSKKIISTKDLKYLKEFVPELIAERNARGNDIESPEILRAAMLANNLLPYPPYGLLCIDGRVTLTSKFGIFGGMKGGAIQLPAGDPLEFIRSENGELSLVENSNIAKQIHKVIKMNGDIAEILDSHTGCAAKKASEIGLGHYTKDDGVLQDVLRKKAVGEALKRHVKKNYPGKKAVIIQGSYDPQTGFSYTGLESEFALEYAQKHHGFTQETLNKLVEKGKIISTQKIAEEFKSIFKDKVSKFNPKPDWINAYKETALQFWQTLASMEKTILPRIIKKIKSSYGKKIKDKNELKMRAVLILANSLSGFCANKFPHHEESFVSVTSRDYSPFSKMGFRVYDADFVSLARNVVFASGIVRANRVKTLALPSYYKSKEDYAASPVVAVVKEIFKVPMHEGRWEKMQRINWDCLKKAEWLTLSDREFLRLIAENNPDITIGVTFSEALLNLREKVKILYDWREPSAQQILNGNLVILPVICDKSRRFQLIVPF